MRVGPVTQGADLVDAMLASLNVHTMASGAVATLRASLGEEGDGACFDALTTVVAGWNASGAQGRDAAAIDEEVERVLSEHFDVVCACACVSERCSSLAQHVARAVATRCSAREEGLEW